MKAFETGVRRLFCAMLVVALVFASSSVALAKVGETYSSRVGGLHVRQKAQAGSDIVTKLSKGQKVIHLSTSKGWWKIRTRDGVEGYVYRTYLKPATTTYQKNAYYKVYAISRLAVREGPRATATKTGTLRRGATVQLKGKQGDYGYVANSAGKTGWVLLKYLKFYKL